MDPVTPSRPSPPEPTLPPDSEVMPIEDPVELEIIIAKTRSEFHTSLETNKQSSLSTTVKVRTITIIGFIILILVVLPLVLVPLFVHHKPTSPTASIQSDLQAFSLYERGQSATNAQVQLVQREAVQTPSGSGVTVWAMYSGSTCYGVSVGPGEAGSVQTEPNNYCSPTPSTLPPAT
jgi:hypothetical protein